jgi:DNA-binding winged helix-turn-helix (wHTH) protein
MIAAQLSHTWPERPVVTRARPALPRIGLAHEPDFALGTLRVSPSSREVVRGDWTDGLEPRVMQVLVALHQADGGVVSRDDLIARCWDGRVVGDDAINRAIGRLRKLSKTDHGASFMIETIPRVGYRMRLGVPGIASAPRSGWRQAAIALFTKLLKG